MWMCSLYPIRESERKQIQRKNERERGKKQKTELETKERKDRRANIWEERDQYEGEETWHTWRNKMKGERDTGRMEILHLSSKVHMYTRRNKGVERERIKGKRKRKKELEREKMRDKKENTHASPHPQVSSCPYLTSNRPHFLTLMHGWRIFQQTSMLDWGSQVADRRGSL